MPPMMPMATCGFPSDFADFCARLGHAVISVRERTHRPLALTLDSLASDSPEIGRVTDGGQARTPF